MSEKKIAIKLKPKLCKMCDGMITVGRKEKTSKFAALSGCTYNDEICFVGIEPKSNVCHPARDLDETVT